MPPVHDSSGGVSTFSRSRKQRSVYRLIPSARAARTHADACCSMSSRSRGGISLEAAGAAGAAAVADGAHAREAWENCGGDGRRTASARKRTQSIFR